ncbi:agaA33, partial [Symbiodinium pilosum]
MVRFKRLFCFFELPTSLPVAVNAGRQQRSVASKMKANMLPRCRCRTFQAASGGFMQFSQDIQPSLSLIVDDAFIQHMTLDAFLLEEAAYQANGGHCLPPIGLDAMVAETAASYIQRSAPVPLKPVSVLPSPVNGATHFVSIAEDETQSLGIGSKYVLCYVGSSSDTTRVFNQVGRSLSMMDIILSLDKEQRPLGDEAATSQEINAMVQASLTGSVSCIATTRTFDRALIAAELVGDYATSMPPDFVPVFQEAQVLGRALDVPVPWTSKVHAVRIEASPQSAANIQRMPLGVAPQVFVWCKHSKSLVVFPEDGDGIAISLGVLAAPNFGYVSLGSPLTQVVLARSVSFPTLSVLWSQSGFPAYYYDEVAFTITPTLPDGILISDQDGGIKADPLPLQLLPAADFVVKAQSKFDVLQATSTTLKLAVEEPAQCGLSSIKSTEAMVTCIIHDASNMKVEAIYLQIVLKTGEALDLLPTSFSCSGVATDPGSAGMTDFNCQKVGADQCCCWLWVGQSNTPTVFNTSRLKAGKILNSACDLQSYQRYDVLTMATGVNLMS